MSAPIAIGPLEDPCLALLTLRQSKKKRCKKQKCSHWKGGKCRCGRD